MLRSYLSLASFMMVATGLSGWSGTSQGAAQRLWPLSIPPSISSTFGEYREGHLHAGIDIRTLGSEGLPCRAVGDGYVSRIRASSTGYGKAIYIQLTTGETAVYAHLSEFSPALESALYQRQIRLGRYELDAYLPPGEFPVKRGDVIGYTGSTGAEAPHLHFEIRDSRENPMNPLSSGWALEDSIFPEIVGILWIPLGKEARIDGLCLPREVRTERIDECTFACRDTVRVKGGLGLAARIIDRFDTSSGRLSPYWIELYVNREPVARIELERFSFSHAGEVNVLYEMERARTRREYYTNLFSWPGETLWNRWFRRSGVIRPSAEPVPAGSRSGLHIATVRVSDRAGNTSTLTVPFYKATGDPREVPSATGAFDTFGDMEIPGLFIFRDLLSVQTEALSEEALSGLMSGQDGSKRPEPPFARTAESRQFVTSCRDLQSVPLPLTLSPHLGGHRLYVLPLRSARARTVQIPSLGVSLRIGPRTLYGDTFLYLSESATPAPDPKAGEELEPRSRTVRLGPLSLALRADVGMGFHLDAPAESSDAVYRFDERKAEWVFNSSYPAGDTIVVCTRQPGIYAVLSDRSSPRIHPPFLQKHRLYANGRVLPEIVIPIEDAGSGVDDKRIEILIDGEKRIAQWDGFSKKMFVLLREENIIGYCKLTVVAFDRTGNVSRLETKLNITEDYFSESEKGYGEHVE